MFATNKEQQNLYMNVLKEQIAIAARKGFPYYCYHLIDPRDGKVFYVGKGKGERMFQHNRNNKNNVYKALKIKQIIEAGYEIKRVIFSFHSLQCDALGVEKEQIVLLKEQQGLTNIVMGHNDCVVKDADYYLQHLIPFNIWLKIKNRTIIEVEYYHLVVKWLFELLPNENNNLAKV